MFILKLVDEHALELDQLGAVGGSGNSLLSSQNVLESSDTFPDVFSELPVKTMDDGDRSGNGKKVVNIVHHFQSGPNLQLPTIHRLPSQSLKHAEGRVVSVVGTLEGNSPTGSAATSTSTVIHPSTGARSKVREKKREREGRLSSSGGDEGAGELEPLPSLGAGGRRKSKDRWPWGRNSKTGSDQHRSAHEEQDLSAPAPSSAQHELSALPTAGKGGRTLSRDSGIDIWVSTNGQVSGSSSRSSSAALLNARSSFDSMTQRHTVPLVPGRASLDSNLQRLHFIGGRGMPSTTDSGIPSSYISSTVSSSLDNTPPLEMDNPLFHLMDRKTYGNIQGSSNKVIGSMPSQHDRNTTVISNSEESLITFDGRTENDTEFSGPPDDKFRKQRRSTPQIEVTDIFKKISVVEEGDQADLETPNTAEQRVSNVNERRLSSALSLFDPFSPEADEASVDLVSTSEFTKESSFESSAKFIGQEAHMHDSADSLFATKPNGTAMVIDEGQKLDQVSEGHQGHSRQDSSGSSQSASSLKLNIASEAPSKQPTPEASDDKV